MKKEEGETYSLIKGSVYKIVSAGSSDAQFETEGTFLGYVPFGDESALSVRLTAGEQKGTVRIVPCNSVFYIDVLKQEKDNRKDSKEEKPAFYG
ncbi:MAG: hypothetical protein KIS30_00790 [Thermoplasmata archaeon]|nr:hypothetical protein [Candidatus Sysuiplasma acidicola]MBX8645286.1 hypothetical protein [Candidatus Sysuiplasma acidicola]MDH2906198.1 hypothetical protein [Methanomassiliicoccales archaeon]